MNVGIVGLGLLGGSLARALKETGDPPRILGADTNAEACRAAREAGAVDVVEARSVAVAAAVDVLVYATPLGITLDLLSRHREAWAPETLVMDVASLKAPVRDRILAVGAEALWVGVHPMAGGERSGFAASRPDLFRDATIWLTRAGDPTPAAERAERFWAAVGGRCVWVDAAEHDHRMVCASHLPQLAANALAAVLGEAELTRDDLGPGGRDMTRLAGSSPELWAPLLAASGAELPAALRKLAGRLEELAVALDRGHVDTVVAEMTRTRRWKERGAWS